MHATRVRYVLTLAVVGAIFATVSPASAHLAEKTDPNDPGLLDIRRMTFSHKNGFITTTLTTDDAWTLATLGRDDPGTEQGNDNGIFFQWDTRSGRFADFYAVVDAKNGELRGWLYKWKGASGPNPTLELVGPISDVSKDGKTVRVRLAKSRLDPDKSGWGWMGQTLFDPESGPCASSCADVLPNEFMVPHTV